jgi:hypothetical protein
LGASCVVVVAGRLARGVRQPRFFEGGRFVRRTVRRSPLLSRKAADARRLRHRRNPSGGNLLRHVARALLLVRFQACVGRGAQPRVAVLPQLVVQPPLRTLSHWSTWRRGTILSCSRNAKKTIAVSGCGGKSRCHFPAARAGATSLLGVAWTRSPGGRAEHETPRHLTTFAAAAHLSFLVACKGRFRRRILRRHGASREARKNSIEK